MKRLKHNLRLSRRPDLQTGLTLVEVLLALAIAGLLLAAALRVTTTALRCSEVGDAAMKNVFSRAQLERLLAMDIQDAESYRLTEDGGFELKLRFCLDADNLAIKHLPSTVAYRIVKADDRPWLIRTQTQGTDILCEFAAADVEKITSTAESLPEDDSEENTPTSVPSTVPATNAAEPESMPATTSAPAEDAWQEMPDKFSVTIDFTEGKEPSRTVSCLLK